MSGTVVYSWIVLYASVRKQKAEVRRAGAFVRKLGYPRGASAHFECRWDSSQNFPPTNALARVFLAVDPSRQEPDIPTQTPYSLYCFQAMHFNFAASQAQIWKQVHYTCTEKRRSAPVGALHYLAQLHVIFTFRNYIPRSAEDRGKSLARVGRPEPSFFSPTVPSLPCYPTFRDFAPLFFARILVHFFPDTFPQRPYSLCYPLISSSAFVLPALCCIRCYSYTHSLFCFFLRPREIAVGKFSKVGILWIYQVDLG